MVSPAELRAIGALPTRSTDGLAPFDHALQPQPGRERQPPKRRRGRFPDIEHNDAEVAGLQHERERADRLLQRALVQVAAQAGVGDDVAANPQQAIEIDAGGRR